MNPVNLARAIERQLSDRAMLDVMGSAARENAERHTPEKSFESFWNLHAGSFARAQEVA